MTMEDSAAKVDILLFGLGAIGSFYAFILNRSPNVQLTVVARSNYEAVKANGITIHSANHGTHHFIPFKVVNKPIDAAGHYDYVVCSQKAIDQKADAMNLVQVVSDDTTIVLAQNGVGNEDPFREVFPKCSIISGVVWVGATQTAPGIIYVIKSENTEIGLFPNPAVDPGLEKSRLDNFIALLRGGGTNVIVSENIQVLRWEKVIWNVAWNSITTLTMLDTKSWLNSSPTAVPLSRKLMQEVVEVAKKAGVPMKDDLVDRMMERILALPPVITSMQKDLKKGMPLEVDVILGVPVRKARELGVHVPILETIYTLTMAVDYGLREKKFYSPS